MPRSKLLILSFLWIGGPLFLAFVITLNAGSRNTSNTVSIVIPIVATMFSGLMLMFFHDRLSRPLQTDRKTLIVVAIVGLVFRLLFASVPSYPEDDYYRYMWDGAVLVHGYNPYRWAPLSFLGTNGTEDIPSGLTNLAETAKPALQSINHPYLRTLYPPVAQLFFAIAHILSPWNPMGLIVIYLFADTITFFLLSGLLKKAGMNPLGVILFWWNPLYIREIYQYLHMDALLCPFLLGTLYLALGRRFIPASVCLVFAMGIKGWPVVILPLLLKMINRHSRTLLETVFITGIGAVVIALPVILSGAGTPSGWAAYVRSWENNDLVFRILKSSLHLIFAYPMAGILARMVVSLTVLAILYHFVRKPSTDARELYRSTTFVVASLFLFSPTQFPWYTSWFIPLLCLHFDRAWMVYTVTLPMYRAIHLIDIGIWPKAFLDIILILEHGPVILILLTRSVKKSLWQRQKGYLYRNLFPKSVTRGKDD